MRETFERLIARISPQRRQTLIVALGLAGLALILLSSLLPEKPEEKDAAQEQSAVSSTADGSREQLESELASMLSSIEGAGAVRVMITMDTTAEDVYAVDRTASEGSSAADGASQPNTQHSEQNAYVIVKGKDGSEQAILRKQRMPEIRGVLVVCTGGGSAVTREKITAAAAGALGVPPARVVVTN